MGSPAKSFPPAAMRRRAVFLAATAVTGLLLLHGFCGFLSGASSGQLELPLATSSRYFSLSASIALSPINRDIPQDLETGLDAVVGLWEFDGRKLGVGGKVAEFFGGSIRRSLRTSPGFSPPSPKIGGLKSLGNPSPPPSLSPSPSPSRSPSPSP